MSLDIHTASRSDASSIDAGAPLSAAQTEVWLASQLSPQDYPYTIGEHLKIDGSIDIASFRRSIELLVAETESIHVRIRTVEGELRQVRSSELSCNFRFIDFSDAPEPQSAADAFVQSEMYRPLGVTDDSLYVFFLVRSGPQRFIFLHRYHHVLIDGLSMSLLARRAAEIYTSIIRRRPIPVSIRGASGLLTQDEIYYRNSAQYRTDRAYWVDLMHGAPPPVSPTGRAPASTTRRIRHTTLIPSEQIGDYLTEGRLERRAASLFITAVGALLSHLCGAEDIVIKIPVKSRARLEGRPNIVGMSANLLPLRLRVRRSDSLEYLIRETSHQLERLLKHQLFRGADIYSDTGLAAEGDQSGGCGVNFMNLSYDFRFGDAPVLVDRLVRGLCQDLTFVVYPSGDDIRVDLYGDATLYTPAELMLHSERFVHLVNVASSDPSRLLGDLDLILPQERRLLMQEWSRTGHVYPSERCLHHLFEDRVRRDPEAIAIEHDGMLLSYGELNARANRLAHRLIDLGVRPDTLVAICVERSAAMVAAVLAVLKAGGAYIPLDPGYPPERLIWLLADAAPKVVLADDSGRLALGAEALGQYVSLDPRETIPDLPCTDPTIAGLTSGHLAYVIYTSGSTGRPKGVMVEHGSATRLLEATHHWFGFDEHDVWSLFHSLSFDFSVWEIWGALRYGGRLLIIPQDVARSSDVFHRLVCSAGVTVLNQTPSAFRAFMESDRRGNIRHSLRHVIFGGEVLDSSMLRAWYARHAEEAPRLTNMYGTTETAVLATGRFLSREDVDALGSSIGTPIPDLSVYVVDGHGSPAPIGVAGELWIGGPGVARGYLNRPDLTAERFVADPFGMDPRARLYRTGDRARWLPDGTLEFLGRNDDQVKIRGFRIEPGEIAACLAEHPAVRDAVVLPLGEDGDKRLVAYVFAASTADAFRPGDLRDHLASRLPHYMVPSAYVRIDALPLTPNGKLDRRALPDPDSEALAHASYEPPRSEAEKALAAVWSELLDVGRISRNDSFFALGGHSLLAVRLLDKMREIGADVTLHDLFTIPTLKNLAELLPGSELRTSDQAGAIGSSMSVTTAGGEISVGDAPGTTCAPDLHSATRDTEYDPLVPLVASGHSRTPLLCIPGAGANVAGFMDLAQELNGRLPIYGLQPRGVVRGQQPHRTVEEAASCYLHATSKLTEAGPVHLLGHSFGGIVAFEMACRLQWLGRSVVSLTVIDSGPPPINRDVSDSEALVKFIDAVSLTLDNTSYMYNPTKAQPGTSEIERHLDALRSDLVKEGQLSANGLTDDLAVVFATFLAAIRVRYQPSMKYDGVLRLVQVNNPRLDSEASTARNLLLANRWQEFVSALDLWRGPGHHYSILRNPNAAQLADWLKPIL